MKGVAQHIVKLASIGAVAALVSIAGPSGAAAQGVAFSLKPAIDYVWWDDALGFEDTYLYGGAVSFDLGPFVALQPFYLYRSDVDANPGDINDNSALFGDFAARKFDIEHLGVDARFNLARGSVVPFVRAGGGLLRFEPSEEGGERRDQISLKAGGGLSFGFGRLQAEVFAEDWAFRVNRFGLYSPAGPDGALPDDPGDDDLFHNLVAGASLNIPLGGGYTDLGQTSGLQGVAFSLEPFVGRLDYDSDFDLDEQWLAGGRLGLDFSSVFGLRGFYWRGVNDDFDDFQDIQAYGGEGQFNLNTGPGISPYLVAGAGRIDFSGDDGDSAVDSARAVLGDRTSLILGGGISFNLSERARLNASARDYIFDQSGDLGDVQNTDNLTHNLMLSAGVTFSLGGNTVTREDITSDETRRLREETERLRRENERLRRARERGEPATVIEREMITRIDTVVITNEQGEREVREVVRGRVDGARTITIPVPTEGEIILRYGTAALRVGPDGAMRPAAPGAISPAEIRAIIRDEMERERARRGVAPQPGQEAMGEAEMELLERRLADRIDEVITRRLGNQQPQQPVQPGVVVVPDRGGQADAAAIERRLNEMERRLSQQVDEAVRRRTAELEDEVERLRDEEREMVIVEGDTVLAVQRQPGIFQRFQQMDLRETRPYIGVSFDPTQFVIGGRLNLGPVTPNSPFNLVPELAFGIGEDDPTLLLAANLQYNFGAIGGGIPLSPYVSVGGGLFSKTFLAVNAAVGTSVNLRDAGFGEPLRGFVEFQGLNLFNRQRLLVGLSIDTP